MTTSLSRTVTVRRDPVAVAAYLADFTTSASWDPHTVSCRRLDDGPLGPGARFENVQRLAGRTSTLLYELQEWVPGRRVVLTGGNETVRSRDEIDISPAPTGATITYTIHIDLLGRAKVGTAFMPLLLRKIAADAVRALPAAVERDLPAGTPA